MRQNLLSTVLLTLGLTVSPLTLAQAAQSGSSTTAPSSTTPAPSGTTSGKHVQQFKTEAEAKSACGSQSVVWANTSSHALHAPGSKYYGKTKHGAYVCETTAMQSGYHMTKGAQ
jgi:hypothetical protein